VGDGSPAARRRPATADHDGRRRRVDVITERRIVPVGIVGIAQNGLTPSDEHAGPPCQMASRHAWLGTAFTKKQGDHKGCSQPPLLHLKPSVVRSDGPSVLLSDHNTLRARRRVVPLTLAALGLPPPPSGAAVRSIASRCPPASPSRSLPTIPRRASLTLSPAGTLFVGSRDTVSVRHPRRRQRGARAKPRIVARGSTAPTASPSATAPLYWAEISRILRFDNIERASTAVRRRRRHRPVSARSPSRLEVHRLRSDGWLYVPVGAPCNVSCRRGRCTRHHAHEARRQRDRGLSRAACQQRRLRLAPRLLRSVFTR